MVLSSLNIGEIAIIENITTETSLTNRLKSLNVYVGKKVKVMKYSLFKKDILIEVDNLKVAMRLKVASQIYVRKL